ncbi:TPA: LLM class flavin-dependent oxidoreductase [Candidatus Poribacteria bacterium]|nr:LLM class flavin-dependent oxidoreductase [Candidatus Poribacteria bacterium]HIA67584.1 LLM class flavin-dependent oxidoreductase [Candidatus Poribacteria bacterium]HIO77655.1 LLM class flavin-dependent oxidoreductase [Candidatus Poribacteria bacterium]
MKFGLFYEHQIPRPWDDGDELQLFQDALAQVELADQLGFDYIWEVEHHFLEEYSHSSAPEVFLAACSQRTKQIRLGHGIVLHPPAYNHPARIAERLATLDLVSNGRVEWGTGESASRVEIEAFNIDPTQKREMWLESVRETAKMMVQSPYSGCEGKYFSMPSRNIVPKPVQKPHPPIWVACSNRETIRVAAKLGIGALTFAFIDPEEARSWVDEYYEIFQKECTPIGQAVNPNIAMVTGFSCHEKEQVAAERSLKGLRFFMYALNHFYFNGSHTPSKTDIWQAYEKTNQPPLERRGGIGTPLQIRDHLAKFEEAGVDQIIFIQQAGKNLHRHICESLELFTSKVLPEFKERDQIQTKQKTDKLADAIKRAKALVKTIPSDAQVPTVEAYPILQKKLEGHPNPTDQQSSWSEAIEGGKQA